ncbi:universal stress protein [Streptomyces sp. NPDC047197]|uniref:universal stress protein n=1 Tax=Streptomyces sp. NPDC047197 TaxID=3155477 RepID=UPI00340B50D4
MSLPLVVGVDGSESSLRAVDWAADEAALRRAPLRVVYASRWERYEGAALARELGEPSAQVSPEEIVRAAERRAHGRADLTVTTAVVTEEAEYVLIHESRNASAVVVGTRGRGALADALLGSVSLSVATHAHCPVVVVRGDRDDRTTGRRSAPVVLGVADEPTPAVRFAYEEARLHAVPVEAVRAWRCPSHETADHPLLAGQPERLHEERAVEQLEAALADAPPDVKLRRRTAEGPAGKVLLAASHEAGLLVVGRRRPKHLGPHLGRVTHRLLHHAACPVAIVPDAV